jgi:homoserine kinase
MKRLRLEVPATSANLGPGFDTLGMALDIVDTVEVELDAGARDVTLDCVEVDDRLQVHDRLQVDDRLHGDELHLDPHDNLICQGYRSWFAEEEKEPPGARFTLRSRIPIGKGFGSSAASLVAGLATAAFVSETKEPPERMLRLATRLEGHADNVAPAIMGGVTVAFCEGDAVYALHVANHLSLGVALFVPEETLPTAEARSALPHQVPLADAVYDLGRLAYLTTALIWGRWELIGPAMRDRLHQPYRASLIPAMDPVINAALEAGAYGAALSGGGPAVIALGPRERAVRFADAMQETACRHDWKGTSLVTQIRAAGVQLQEDREGDTVHEC